MAPQVTSFAVKFLGCKVSQADAMLARDALLAAGHTEASEAEAELHVINTCCITREAEAKSRQSVRRSLGSADQVFVAGCATNLNAAQFGDIDVRVTPFVGTADDVAAAIGTESGACVDLEHDVLARQPVASGASGAPGASGRRLPALPVPPAPPARGPAGSSRSRTGATAPVPTASSRRFAARLAPGRRAPCSPRFGAASPRASRRWS